MALQNCRKLIENVLAFKIPPTPEIQEPENIFLQAEREMHIRCALEELPEREKKLSK